jgi:hypothetical protein
MGGPGPTRRRKAQYPTGATPRAVFKAKAVLPVFRSS